MESIPKNYCEVKLEDCQADNTAILDQCIGRDVYILEKGKGEYYHGSFFRDKQNSGIYKIISDDFDIIPFETIERIFVKED